MSISYPKNDEEFLNDEKKYVLNFPVKRPPIASSNIKGYKIHIKECGFLREPYISSSFTKWCGDSVKELKDELAKTYVNFSKDPGYVEYLENNIECPCIKKAVPIINFNKKLFNYKNHSENKTPQEQTYKINYDVYKKAFQWAADYLIDVFNNEKIPSSKKTFYEPLGLNSDILKDETNNQLLKLLICALYDQNGFLDKDGWKKIWGMNGYGNGIPGKIPELMDYKKMQDISDEEIIKMLQERNIYYTRYKQPFGMGVLDIKNKIIQIKENMLKAKDNNDIRILYEDLTHKKLKITGIAETIAAKIILYVLRELNATGINPEAFEFIGRKLSPELHNNKGINDMSRIARIGQKEVLNLLLENLKKDEMAIDGLFYLQTEQRCEYELFLKKFEEFF